MLHELWADPDPAAGGEFLFCDAGPRGDQARGLLSTRATLVWTVEATSHFEAMTLYYEYQGGARTRPIRTGIGSPMPTTAGSERRLLAIGDDRRSRKIDRADRGMSVR